MQCAHQKKIPTNFQRFTAVDFFSFFFQMFAFFSIFRIFFGNSTFWQLCPCFSIIFANFANTQIFLPFFSLIIALQINAYVRRRINVPLFMNMRLMDWEKKNSFRLSLVISILYSVRIVCFEFLLSRFA